MRFLITLRDCVPVPPTRLINTERLHERAGAIYDLNRSYHCPQCGAVWAEWRKEDELINEWYPIRRSCPNHPYGHWNGDNPGSLIIHPMDLMVLPLQLLERELLLLIEKGTR